MGWMLRDIRSGWRALVKQPGSALLSVVAFALGIGLCTTMFSLVYGVFARGPDIEDPDQVVLIQRANPSRNQNQMGVPQSDFYDWSEQQTSFESLASYRTGTVNVTGTEGPQRYNGGFVTSALFDVLGIQPIIGRTFEERDDDPGAALTLLLGYQVWQDRFAGSPDVLGESIKVNGEQAAVIGVMPAGFQFPSDQELWVADRDQRAEHATRADGSWGTVVGRLASGKTYEQAELEFATIGSRLAQDFAEENEGISPRFTTIVANDTGPELRAIFGSMLIATLFVLMIACANVANLLLARAALRTKEAAVRSSVGASRFQVVFPFFSEALILSAVGALIGIGIAFLGVGLFDSATQGVGKPYYMVFAVDLPILLFVICITLITALVSGAAPAFQVSRTNTNEVLKDESRGSSSFHAGKLSKALVVGQVALSCALLIGAGLMTKSMLNVMRYDYNFLTEEIFTARVGLFPADYPDEAARGQFTDDLLERLRAMPEAEAVGLTDALPGVGSGTGRVDIEGQVYAEDEDMPRVHSAVVTDGFFATVDVDVLEGRDFAAFDDSTSENVAIVNQSMAEELFAGGSPLGRRLRTGGSEDEADWRTIVGIVPDLRMEGFDPDQDVISAGYYVPLRQSDLRFMSIAIRTRSADVLGITQAVQNAVRSVDPDLPLYNVFTLQGSIDQSGWFYKVFGTLFVVFGAAALFLASVGLYGVLSFSVSRRVQEMGIRMALGAGARDVISLVLRQGLVQLGIGLAIGLVMAVGLSRVLGILMFEVDAQDPVVFATITLIIVAVGLAASFVPAKRATNVDPMEALRY